jgi:Nucleotide modification associated domain 2
MLFSYKMTHDTGFAPNPFHDILSLATCKPQIRLKKQKGHYIAGFTSGELCNDKVGEERLVYIMRVTEKVSFDTYWKEPRFDAKKPNSINKISIVGDNIYKPKELLDYFDKDNYAQVKNPFHGDNERDDDLSGQFVLLSNDFFYLGFSALPVHHFKINIPRGRSRDGIKTSNENEVMKLWQYLSDNFPKNAVVNKPYGWLK